MMYHMKNIITYDADITLPKCMYHIKNPNSNADEIGIKDQVPNKKMAELEQRQEQLLQKLDILYDRIKTISSFCDQSTTNHTNSREIKQAISTPDEIVLEVNPDNLPWFLNILVKESSVTVNISWHIHSSVPNEKIPKIKAFVTRLLNTTQNSNIKLRLIFKSVSGDSELKWSSLMVPIVGNVNILRYLSLAYPNLIPYDQEDYYVDSLLDLCHLLERTPEKNKGVIINKLFPNLSENRNWIYNKYSIVDIAVYNVVKQWQNSSKYVPRIWFDNCEKIIM